MQKRIRVLKEKPHLPVPTDHYASSDTGYGNSRSSDWRSTSSELSSGYGRIMSLLRESHSATIPEESSTTIHHSSATSENTATTQN